MRFNFYNVCHSRCMRLFGVLERITMERRGISRKGPKSNRNVTTDLKKNDLELNIVVIVISRAMSNLC